MLIDAGPKTERYDAGEKIVVPELRRLRVREIDLMVLTHPDSDHIGGLAAIAKKHAIGMVVVAEHFRDHPELMKALASAKLPYSRVTYVKRPTETAVGRFKLLIDAPAWQKGGPDNDGSLFMWLGHKKSTAVFTGDAGIEAEAMMQRRRGWKAQVAKVGHHGSYSATSDSWLTHVAPALAIISCGRANAYGHPHQQVLDRLAARKIKDLRTDRDGTIRLQATDEGFIRVR